jgi:hypothetical protein
MEYYTPRKLMESVTVYPVEMCPFGWLSMAAERVKELRNVGLSMPPFGRGKHGMEVNQ